MSKTAFHYNKLTKEIIGRVSVSRNSDLILNKKEGLEMMEVSNSHRALGVEHEYIIKQGKIQRKPQHQIDMEFPDYGRGGNKDRNKITK